MSRDSLPNKPPVSHAEIALWIGGGIIFVGSLAALVLAASEPLPSPPPTTNERSAPR